jgi:NADPH:quinone reductase-like Zn-dependent oxidoreductase
MKAIQAAEHGGYEALHLVDMPRPQPQAGQVLVRVTSVGVTPLDRTVLAGLHPRAAAPPLVPGNEGASVVIEDPSGRFPAGERVLFFAPAGVDVVIDALGGQITGQAVGGLARGGRLAVMGYAAGTETTLRVTDLVWKLARISGFSLLAASAEEQAPEALRHLIEDRPFGTVTLSVGNAA